MSSNGKSVISTLSSNDCSFFKEKNHLSFTKTKNNFYLFIGMDSFSCSDTAVGTKISTRGVGSTGVVRQAKNISFLFVGL
jgi:hypothetical protein